MKTLPLALILILIMQIKVHSKSVHEFTRDNILGTHMHIKIICDSDLQALEAYNSGIDELSRLDKIFNSYDKESEISRLESQQKTTSLSSDLFNVFQLAKQARSLSNGRFCSVSPLMTKIWSDAQDTQELPSLEKLQSVTQLITKAEAYKLQPTNSGGLITQGKTNSSFNLDAISKGYIIDSVFTKIIHCTGVTSALVNIGGDLRSGGKDTRYGASVRDPRCVGTNLSSFEMNNRSIATSSGSQRFYNIKGKSYSHIIDARNGFPAEENLSASVIAPNAAQADMLATILSMMPAASGLKLIASIAHCECLLLLASGEIKSSSGWPRSMARSSSKIKIDLELLNSISGQKFKRHYAVVWIENTKGEKVRDITLWYSKRYSKYLKTLETWWSQGGDDVSKDKRLLKTISESTKRLGSYTVTWDERDNKRKSLPKGKYTVCIEVNRERPGKDIPTVCRIDIDTNQKTFSIDGKNHAELGSVKVSR